MALFFKSLIGEYINGIEVTEEILKQAENNIINKRRKKLHDQRSPDEIIVKSLTKEDIISGIKSVLSLKRKGEEVLTKEDQIRNIRFSLEEFDGYRPAEQEFIQERLSEYYNGYSIEKPNDKFLVVRAVVIELKLMQLEQRCILKPKEAPDIQKLINTLDDQYRKTCESLNTLKKQRDNTKKKDTGENDYNAALEAADKDSEDIITADQDDLAEEMKYSKKSKTRRR